MGPRAAGPRGQSRWAARCAVLSTFALLACLVVSGSARSLCAFIWVCLALAAMVLEWTARRRVQRAVVVPRQRR